jgi:hypothetical protein
MIPSNDSFKQFSQMIFLTDFLKLLRLNLIESVVYEVIKN